MSSFTLHLLSLKCVQAQELDGDEAYIRYNGVMIWAAEPMRMSHRTKDATGQLFDEFNFMTGQYHTPQGWVSGEIFEERAFVFEGQTEPGVVELWEDDSFLRGGDDFLGKVSVGTQDIGRGHITTSFEQDGASYLLTYEVTA
ncbi:MAG: hypothetical protein H7175_11380 [Burkholderiales bacterium]|nr:hypothetical protein [Anaerolineae bacterium]